MEGIVMVGKGEMGGERVMHGREIGDGGWGRYGRDSDGGERGVGW